LVGIESFSQSNLDFVQKKETIERIREVADGLRKRNLFLIGYYIIGFEGETPDSIMADMSKLRKLGLDMCQICILTPLPGTPMWEYLDQKYGIFDRDYSRFAMKHLVWNHPGMKPEEMSDLLSDCFRMMYSPRTFFGTLLKFSRKYTRDGFWKGLSYMAKSVLRANISYHLEREYRALDVERGE